MTDIIDTLIKLGYSDIDIHDILKKFPNIKHYGDKINGFHGYLKNKGFEQNKILNIIKIKPRLSKNSNETLDESFELLLEYFSDPETKEIVTNFPNILSADKVRKNIKFQLLELYDLKQHIVDKPKDLICGLETLSTRVNFFTSQSLPLSDKTMQSYIFHAKSKFEERFHINSMELLHNYSYIPDRLLSSIIEPSDSCQSGVDRVFQTHSDIFNEVLTLEKFVPLYADTLENHEVLEDYLPA
ncbi:MAG TPA: hypothetical protein DEP72_00615 [Clostridiales bacterium]|nr:MAG: hypothetical protein A2Y18_02965 [Clostridiales bacterium GWD2_32_19]HCC06654.1 hypothetical protein [Clostridiales bacterium]